MRQQETIVQDTKVRFDHVQLLWVALNRHRMSFLERPRWPVLFIEKEIEISLNLKMMQTFELIFEMWKNSMQYLCELKIIWNYDASKCWDKVFAFNCCYFQWLKPHIYIYIKMYMKIVESLTQKLWVLELKKKKRHSFGWRIRKKFHFFTFNKRLPAQNVYLYAGDGYACIGHKRLVMFSMFTVTCRNLSACVTRGASRLIGSVNI